MILAMNLFESRDRTEYLAEPAVFRRRIEKLFESYRRGACDSSGMTRPTPWKPDDMLSFVEIVPSLSVKASGP